MPIKKPLMNGFFIGSWGDKTIPGSILAPIASPVRWRSGGKYGRKSSHLPVLVLRILHPADDLVYLYFAVVKNIITAKMRFKFKIITAHFVNEFN